MIFQAGDRYQERMEKEIFIFQFIAMGTEFLNLKQILYSYIIKINFKCLE